MTVEWQEETWWYCRGHTANLSWNVIIQYYTHVTVSVWQVEGHTGKIYIWLLRRIYHENLLSWNIHSILVKFIYCEHMMTTTECCVAECSCYVNSAAYPSETVDLASVHQTEMSLKWSNLVDRQQRWVANGSAVVHCMNTASLQPETCCMVLTCPLSSATDIPHTCHCIQSMHVKTALN